MQDWAWLIAAGFWALLVIFLCAALVGLYRVLQSTRRSRMTLKLIGPLDNCSKPSRARRPQSLGLTDLSSPAAQISRKKGGSRKLVGKGRCNCKAKGRRGSATTLATIWVLEDLSGGVTRVTVRKGVVIFHNSYTGKRKRVRRGETAVARPPRR